MDRQKLFKVISAGLATPENFKTMYNQEIKTQEKTQDRTFDLQKIMLQDALQTGRGENLEAIKHNYRMDYPELYLTDAQLRAKRRRERQQQEQPQGAAPSPQAVAAGVTPGGQALAPQSQGAYRQQGQNTPKIQNPDYVQGDQIITDKSGQVLFLNRKKNVWDKL